MSRRIRPTRWSAFALGTLGVLGLLLLSACSSGTGSNGDTDSASPTASVDPNAETSLTVTVNNKERTDVWTVTCNPDGGTHPEPSQVCNFLDLSAQWGKDPFAPVEADKICAQVYGGPETATVTGTWNGKPVDAQFNRTDACEIERWSTALPILVVEGAPPSEDQPR